MKYTIKDFKKEFPTDNACLEYVFKQKFGKDFTCPKCSKTGFYRVKGRKCYACAWCAYQIHPLASSIFHKSSTKLTDWFFALYKFSNSKNGVSAKELQRDLGCTYKTAWRIAKQIRSLMSGDDKQLKGTIEADETYFGGKIRKQGRGVAHKTGVFGAVERKGSVKTKVLESTTARYEITGLVRKHIAIDARLMTDDHSAYHGLKKQGYNHKIINHSKERYARGSIYTNTIEGFWSQLKRSTDGTYHSVSKKYLQNYADEFSYRYNRRASDLPLFHHFLREICA